MHVCMRGCVLLVGYVAVRYAVVRQTHTVQQREDVLSDGRLTSVRVFIK